MKTWLLMSLLALVPGPSLAEGGSMHLVAPKGSPLVVLQVERELGTKARFAGQVWVTGTFVGRWPMGAADTRDASPDYILVPDPAGVRRLPYFFLREPPYFNRYRVTGIQVTNGDQALRHAVGEGEAKRLLERKVDSVRATGTFLIEAYEVGVECDAPWAKARLVKARVPERLAARHRDVVEGC